MMYRSQLMLDLSNPSVRRGLADCNDMHRNLMKAFDFSDRKGDTPRADIALQYRVLTVNGQPSIFVLSEAKPNWDKVHGIHLVNDVLCIDRLKDVFKTNARFRFQVLASPTKKVKREGKLSARVFLRTREERENWLRNKAKRAGFSIISIEEGKQVFLCGRKQQSKICYTGVNFQGILSIDDEEAFWNAYKNGIGPGKAYGLGMLMIAR